MSRADSKPAIFEHVLQRSDRFGKERLSVVDGRANASLELTRLLPHGKKEIRKA